MYKRLTCRFPGINLRWRSLEKYVTNNKHNRSLSEKDILITVDRL